MLCSGFTLWLDGLDLIDKHVLWWVFLLQTPVFGRREDTDIVNDETFGFLESGNDDRSVEERKRRGEYNILSSIPYTVLTWGRCNNAGYLLAVSIILVAVFHPPAVMQ